MDDPPFGVTSILYATNDAYTHMHVSGINTALHALECTLIKSPFSYMNRQ